MRPFSIVLVLFASAQFTAAVPATVERESTTIPSRLLTGYFSRGTIEPTNLLFNTSPDRRSIANDSFVNQTHASTTPTSTSTTTRTTTPQVSTTTKSDGLLSVQLLKSIEGEDSSSGKVHRLFRRQAACRWTGGCPGDRCWSEEECSEGLTCLRGRCRRGARRLQEKACTWAGHCDGASCQTENDCSDDRVCINGRCGSANQQSNANVNPGRNGNPNRNPNRNPNAGQLPTQNANQNWNPNAFTGTQTPGTTNVGGSGGNGFVIINVSGGNGGGGGSTFAIPRT